MINQSFCAEQNESGDKNKTSETELERALNNYDAHKQEKEKELAEKLNFYLGRAIESWIDAAKHDKTSKLNTYLDINWDELELFYTVPPINHEYYLRGYKYSVLKTDITKTDSLSSPYKAVVIIKEELYAEKNHPANISDINPYFYTVVTNYALSLEYKNDSFIIANSDKKIISMDNDCPSEIKRLRI